MAIAIFNSQANNQIYKVAQDQATFEKMDINLQDGYFTITFNDNDFLKIRLNQASIENYNGTQVQVVNLSTFKYNQASYDEVVAAEKTILNNFLEGRPQNLLVPQFQNYLNQIKNLPSWKELKNYFGLEPTTKTIQTYFQSNSLPFYSSFEVP